ncbi:MAG: urea amidolyase associated protein UAAP1 [Pseudomonadota bacterium]
MTSQADMSRPEPVLWEELVPGGNHWSGLMRRGTALRLTDLQGGANLSALFYNDDERLERYNMADTLKAQHTALLTRGHVLMSDMGRVLASITADDVGGHDAFCGVSDAALIREKYGERPFGAARNAMYRNGRDGLLIELGKWGLGKRDLVPGVNFFSRVIVGDEGDLSFAEGHSRAGATVGLRFDMDVLVVLSAAPHPLDPKPEYAPGPVLLTAWRAGLAAEDDYCRNFRPENARAFINTERYFAQ